MTQKERSRLIKKCDKAFSLRIRLRDGKCVKCGKVDNLQCAHIIPRTYMHTRWDAQNALSLCYRCHIYWAHKDPDAFITWLDERSPGLRQILRGRAEYVGKLDLQAIYDTIRV